MKRLTKTTLRDYKIFNPHGLLAVGGGKVYVGYSPAETGRAYRSAKWQVIRPGFKTDPKAHWMDYGHKTFNVHPVGAVTHHEAKEAQRLAAIEWATARYGITEWERDPFGNYQAKDVMERVRALCNGVARKGEGKR